LACLKRIAGRRSVAGLLILAVGLAAGAAVIGVLGGVALGVVVRVVGGTVTRHGFR